MCFKVYNNFKNNSQGIIIEKSNRTAPSEMPMPHIHNHYEIYYLMDGNSNYILSDEIFHLGAKNLMLIPPGVSHKSSTVSDSTSIKVYINLTYFSSREKDIFTKCFEKRYYTVPKEFSTLVDIIFKNLYKESEQQQSDSSTLIRGYMSLLLSILNRLRKQPEINTASTDTRIRDSLIYISNHIGENLSLDRVAQNVGLNPSYFSRKFKAVVGSNFRDYVIFSRIGKAQQLLSSSNLSFQEISNICGFQDSNYFSTVFKRIIGISPTKFRKQNKDS